MKKDYTVSKVEEANVHPFEIEELACKILGVDYDEIDADSTIIENELYEQFEIDFDIFKIIIDRLILLSEVGHSILTETTYRGFADIDNKMWLAKIEVEKNENDKTNKILRKN